MHTWLNSSEAQEVFNHVEHKLIESVRSNREVHIKAMNMSEEQANITMNDPVYVYLACDNEEVKDTFSVLLESHHEHHFDIRVMKVETKVVHHVKNKLIERTNGEGLLDVVFDWYSLSLANMIFAWRKGGTGTISTFVQSAQRVSGTTERTSIHAPVGLGGIGSKGHVLVRGRGWKWNMMWIDSFHDDYRQPGDS